MRQGATAIVKAIALGVVEALHGTLHVQIPLLKSATGGQAAAYPPTGVRSQTSREGADFQQKCSGGASSCRGCSIQAH